MQLAHSDLRSLAVFRAVVEHHGFVGAQVTLGLSQSTVSFHIKALETRLGFVLCERGRAGFRLTDRGKLVHERSTALFLALNDFESEIGTLRDKIVGTLRLGIVDNTLTYEGLPISRVIQRIRTLAPEAQISISIGEPEELAVEVANGALDTAIIPETKPISGVRMTPLFRERHLLYCARGHPLFGIPEDELTHRDVEAHSFVARNYGRLVELQKFPNAQVGALTAHMEVQAMFILSGAFIGYLPDHFARHRCELGELRGLLASTAPIDSQFVIVSRTGSRTTGLIDLFVRELVGALSEVLHQAPSLGAPTTVPDGVPDEKHRARD